MCMPRIRVPEHWWGDYLGMIGAARIGERELLELGEEVGWDAFDALRRRLVRLQRGAHARGDPRGCRRARRTGYDIHDAVPLPGVEDGVPLKVTVTVDPRGGARSRSTCATTPTACRAG